MYAGIRVYDKDGKYLTTIGRHGRGPGEFVEKSYMTITPENQLVVFDRYQIRVTVFNVNSPPKNQIGDKIDIYDFPEKKPVTPVAITPINQNQFVFAYRHYYPPKFNDSNKINDILNFVSPKFKKIIDYALPLSELGDMSNSFMNHMIGFPFFTLQMTLVDGKYLVVAPHFYDGRIYLLANDKGHWKIRKILHGFVQKKNSIEYYPNASTAPDIAMTGHGDAGVLDNESIGLFPMINGGFIHFTYIMYNGIRQYFLEKYDDQYNLIEYGPIVNLLTYKKRPAATLIFFEWEDRNNQFYFKDLRNLKKKGDQVIRGYFEQTK